MNIKVVTDFGRYSQPHLTHRKPIDVLEMSYRGRLISKELVAISTQMCTHI